MKLKIVDKEHFGPAESLGAAHKAADVSFPGDDFELKMRPAVKPLKSSPVYESDGGLSVRGMIRALAGNLRLIMLMTMIFFILSVGVAFLFVALTRSHTGFSSAFIVFGFPEAQEGLDPFGEPLDINILRSPQIVGQALDGLGLRERGVSSESVRQNLRIREVVPHNTINEIMLIQDSAVRTPERLIELADVVYFPTEHMVTLYRGSGLEELNDQEMTELLNEIVRRYAEHFAAIYNEFRFLDATIGYFDPLAYDYHEIVSVLQTSSNSLISFAEQMKGASGDFRSAATQMTFTDIWNSLDLIRTVDIHRVASLVHINYMSRDRARLARIMDVEIVGLQLQLDIAEANLADVLFLLQEVYEHEQLVFHHSNERFDFQGSAAVYEDFLREAQRLSFRINELKVDIASRRARMEVLRNNLVPPNPSDVRFVDDAIPELLNSLREWEDIINQTAEDFFDTESHADSVRVMRPANFNNSLAAYRQWMVMIVLAGSLGGLFLACMIALYKAEPR